MCFHKDTSGGLISPAFNFLSVDFTKLSSSAGAVIFKDSFLWSRIGTFLNRLFNGNCNYSYAL